MAASLAAGVNRRKNASASATGTASRSGSVRPPTRKSSASGFRREPPQVAQGW